MLLCTICENWFSQSFWIHGIKMYLLYQFWNFQPRRRCFISAYQMVEAVHEIIRARHLIELLSERDLHHAAASSSGKQILSLFLGSSPSLPVCTLSQRYSTSATTSANTPTAFKTPQLRNDSAKSQLPPPSIEPTFV